jgi:hypothetical protein
MIANVTMRSDRHYGRGINLSANFLAHLCFREYAELRTNVLVTVTAVRPASKDFPTQTMRFEFNDCHSVFEILPSC